MKSVVVAACLCLAPLLPVDWVQRAQAAPVAARCQDIPPQIAAELEAALARRFDPSGHEELYRLAMIEWADVAPLVTYLVDLELANEDASGAARERMESAIWLRAHLQWRFGDVRSARRALEELAELAPTADVLWELACLHDTLDERDDARAAYEKALLASPSPELEGLLRLRIAMLAIGQEQSDEDEEEAQSAAAAALVAFGTESARTEDERNRAAVVLAIDGRFAQALELYSVGSASPDSAEGFRRELRMTEWAISAADVAQAKEHAWTSVHIAGPVRDRRYALGLLVEAHRLDDSLGDLITKLQEDPDGSTEGTQVWVELLRETGRFEDAYAWFRASEEAGGGELADDVRRQLLDLCREWGREDLLVVEYRRLIAAHRASIVWREGLSRYLLEKGLADEAREVWADYLVDEALQPYLLTAAESLAGLGLDDLALDACELCVARDRNAYGALLLASSIHRERGRLSDALAQLERLDAMCPPDAAERMALAEGFEELGSLARSVDVLEGVRAARGVAGAAEDLDMRLAWLLSEVDRDEDALALWNELWRRIEAPGRRRYVEERLMSVASRLGVLADIAIDLETKLMRGEANDRDAGLLVQLYSRVNDPVSATEVLEVFLTGTGASKLKELEEKSRIFLQCNDYYRYEKTLRESMELDPEGRPDYLRQLAMSALERGQAQEARGVLDELLSIERGVDSAEFEAGVLALAGLREEALGAYRRGVAGNPDRIENYLLLANVMRELGQRDRAIGMFQYLAERADQDDLFTIAIDGLLNMEAGDRALRWARRCALERIAGRHDKVYLYQLVADLSEQLDDGAFMTRSLESALPISAERRVSLLRELMDLARRGPDKLRFGRRLVNSGQLVPPDVYLELGDAFLQADDVASATRTFAVADSLQESSSFTVDVAQRFQRAMYLARARDAYQRALIGRDVDVGLIVKLGEIHEQLGDDESAANYYRRAYALLMLRQPLTATKGVDVGGENMFDYWSTINVDEYDQFVDRCATGLLTTGADADSIATFVQSELAVLHAELDESFAEAGGADMELAQFPRVARRAGAVRDLALDSWQPMLVEELDLELIARFPSDESLLARLVGERTLRGQHGAARRLWLRADVTAERRGSLAHLFEGGLSNDAGDLDGLAVARLVPRLVAEGRTDELRHAVLAVLGDPKAASEVDAGALYAAAAEVHDEELSFRVLRLWLDRAIANGDEYSARRVMAIAGNGLSGNLSEAIVDHAAISIKSDDTRASQMLGLLLELEESTGRDLLTEDELLDLVERAHETRGYWAVYPFFAVLPPEQFGGVLRQTISKIGESMRPNFLLDLVSNQKQPLSEDAADLVVGAFRESVGKVEEAQYLPYSISEACNNEFNPAVSRAMLEAFTARWGDSNQLSVARIGCLCREGRGDEAIALMLALYNDSFVPAQDDWEEIQARQMAEQTLVEGHLEALVEQVLELGDRTGRRDEARAKCVQLYASAGKPEAKLDFLRQCAERWPDDAMVLGALIEDLRRRPELQWEYLAAIERRATFPTTDEKAFDEVARFWKKLQNPVEEAPWKKLAKAAKAERRAREKAEKAAKESAESSEEPNESVGAAASTSSSGATAGAAPMATLSAPAQATSGSSVSTTASAPAGVIVASGGGISITRLGVAAWSAGDEGEEIVEDVEEDSEKAPVASLQVFRKRFDDGDIESARAVYRRMWRSFQSDEQDNFFFYGGGAGFGGWNGLPEFWPGDLPAEARAILAPEPEPAEESAPTEGDVDAVSALDVTAATTADAGDVNEGEVVSDEVAAADESTASVDDTEVVEEIVADGDAVAVDDESTAVAVAEDDLATDEDVEEGESVEMDAGEETEEGGDDQESTDRRGGLDDFKLPEPPEAVTRYGTYDVLVCLEVGRAEMLRQLRTRSPQQLDACQNIFKALAGYDRRTIGDSGALDALMARFTAGSAGRIELELLLQHLDAGFGAERADVRAVLEQLLTTVSPTDSDKLSSVARLLAIGGRGDWTERLLPWCASLASCVDSNNMYGEQFIVFGDEPSQSPASVSDLVSAARAALTGPARLAVIEQILERARPLDLTSKFDRFFYFDDGSSGSQDEWYANFVLDTWTAELEPIEALAKCRSIVDELLAWNKQSRPAREASRRAALLCARAGAVESAARLLSNSLAEYQAPKGNNSSRFFYFGDFPEVSSRGGLPARELDALFPEDMSGFAAPGAWLEAAARGLRELVDASDKNADRNLQALGLAVWRLGGTDHAAAIDEILAGIESHVATSPESMLWILDGAARSGNTRVARSIERAFADARLLRIDRVVDAVTRVRDSDGPLAALELAERFSTYTLAKPLLALVEELCAQAELPERTERWQAVFAALDAL